MELKDLDVGDKFTLEFVVIGHERTLVYSKALGSNYINYFPHGGDYKPTSITRKPVEPAVGQIWRAGTSEHRRRIVAVEEGFVFYLLNGDGYSCSISRFKSTAAYERTTT